MALETDSMPHQPIRYLLAPRSALRRAAIRVPAVAAGHRAEACS
jgi:hypothetical protein